MIETITHWVTLSIKLVGIVVIAFGTLFALMRYLQNMVRTHASKEHYRLLRSELGRSILLGLEFLVAADIIATVASNLPSTV